MQPDGTNRERGRESGENCGGGGLAVRSRASGESVIFRRPSRPAAPRSCGAGAGTGKNMRAPSAQIDLAMMGRDGLMEPYVQNARPIIVVAMMVRRGL